VYRRWWEIMAETPLRRAAFVLLVPMALSLLVLAQMVSVLLMPVDCLVLLGVWVARGSTGCEAYLDDAAPQPPAREKM
jgi:hypothetical protein